MQNEIELVINIPKEMYNDIKSGKDGYSNYVHTAVRNGIPLPKGHGRLIDADELLKRTDKVAKKSSLSIDTINGLCGAVAIIYDMLIETGQEKGEE